MSTILPRLRLAVKDRVLKSLRRCTDAKLKIRYLIIVLLNEGRSPEHIARHLEVSRSTVYRVAGRFREHGEFGLLDRRAGNGPNKTQGEFLEVLDRLVRSSPQQHGHSRPSWTRELLVRTLVRSKKYEASLDWVWDPLTSAVEAIPCPVCGRPTLAWAWTRLGRLVCPACAGSEPARR